MVSMRDDKITKDCNLKMNNAQNEKNLLVNTKFDSIQHSNQTNKINQAIYLSNKSIFNFLSNYSMCRAPAI